MEVETARGLGKDPSSRTRFICKGLCVLGPESGGVTPCVSLFLFSTISAATIVLSTLVYKHEEGWNILAFIESALSIVCIALMLTVMCSDPGIMARNRLKTINASGLMAEHIDPENTQKLLPDLKA